MNEAKTVMVDFGSIEQAGFTVPIRKEVTQARSNSTPKVFYTLDFAVLKTGDALASFCKGYDSLLAFFCADFDKAMVSLQVTTPANGKTSKVLSDSEKVQCLKDYVSTMDVITRRKTGLASQIRACDKAIADYVIACQANTTNDPSKPSFAIGFQEHIAELSIKRASLLEQQEAESDSAS